MPNLFILSILVGAVLGMRLRVWILIPTIVVITIGIAAFGGARGEEFASIVMAMALAACGLQLGYLSGSATRFVLAATRTARRPTMAPLADDQPVFRA